jgi:hydroxypyruvate isomerase
VLALVHGVNHDWFGVNLDSFNYRTADPYADFAKTAPHAVTVQMKTEVQPNGQKKQPADYARLMGSLRAANYRGYVALEYEAEEEPKTAVPRAIGELKKLMV